MAREICICGHLRGQHRISNSTCKHCECNGYSWDISLSNFIKTALKLFPPTKTGGCYEATRWLITQCSGLEEEIVSIKNKDGDIKHCIAVTLNGLIIDTQHLQFNLVLDLDKKFEDVHIFTRTEHEQYLERYNVGEK